MSFVGSVPYRGPDLLAASFPGTALDWSSMTEVLTCHQCGAQFESHGPGTRCPVCSSRVEMRDSRTSGAVYSFSSGGGFRAITWGGGRSVLIAIAAAIAAPFCVSTGLLALFLGAIFDASVLLTLGAVLMTLGLLAFAFFAWKLRRGLQQASRAWRSAGDAPHYDDDRVEGRWQ